MPVNLRHRSFVKELDFTTAELEFLIQLSADLKRAKYGGFEVPRLTGKKIALIFEKTSTRTRCAFEVAAYDQGAHVTYLGPDTSQMGAKESIRDTARVLGRMYDAIEYRGFGQQIVEELAAHAGVPVYNGLTNEFHPTQMLADMLTMREHGGKPLKEIAYCYLGDARFNTGTSLMIIGCKLGMDVRICAPESLQPRARAWSSPPGRSPRDRCPADVDSDIDCLRPRRRLPLHRRLAVHGRGRNRCGTIGSSCSSRTRSNGDLVIARAIPTSGSCTVCPAFHDRETKVGASRSTRSSGSMRWK